MIRPARFPTGPARTAALAGALLALLAGCGADGPVIRRDFGAVAPPGAPPGTCWDKTIQPAVIETVTEHVLVSPATATSPAEYRTETAQRIVADRQESWFETVCPGDLTPELVASLQRALAARRAYGGAVTGRLDAPTREALRAWQAAEGRDSAALGLDTARELGLVAVPRLDADTATE
ncbi:peptidoglycan-binding domain-containing protein [Mesobacterium pallidum]|uniref:peptidoglycan-binding domain-containing protein n=1 Tax=Mesobacterium pallidum TaxID=2872037 RepID=UPI001EE2CADE|nr:peptidoglycan-binding domain-containing protein [Mesobacterium pallidum]